MREFFVATMLVHPRRYRRIGASRKAFSCGRDAYARAAEDVTPNLQILKIMNEIMEEVMRLAAKLCAATIVCAIFGSCIGVATANPWRLGKNKLPRLSSKPQGIAVEHIHITHWGLDARKRHNR
jgi:hypothetical protein